MQTWNERWVKCPVVFFLTGMMDRFCKQAKTSCGGGGPPSGWTQWLVWGSQPRALNTSELQHNRNQKISGGQQNEQKTSYTSPKCGFFFCPGKLVHVTKHGLFNNWAGLFCNLSISSSTIRKIWLLFAVLFFVVVRFFFFFFLQPSSLLESM